MASLEDLAQLLALWWPGAYGKEREQAYLTARFGSQRPALLHPSLYTSPCLTAKAVAAACPRSPILS
jgi:hypothetical protein